MLLNSFISASHWQDLADNAKGFLTPAKLNVLGPPSRGARLAYAWHQATSKHLTGGQSLGDCVDSAPSGSRASN